MKANIKSPIAKHCDVFLNGELVERPFEASEDDGYVWVDYGVLASFAAPRSFVYSGCQVIKLKGKVEIRIAENTPGILIAIQRDAPFEPLEITQI